MTINKGDIVKSIAPELFTGKGVVLGFESRLEVSSGKRVRKARVLWFEGHEFFHRPHWLVKVEDRGG